jgi:hypothetical protein
LKPWAILSNPPRRVKNRSLAVSHAKSGRTQTEKFIGPHSHWQRVKLPVDHDRPDSPGLEDIYLGVLFVSVVKFFKALALELVE